MHRILKYIAYSIAGLIALIALSLVVITTMVNPNDYRDDISRLAYEAADIELKLGGDLTWRFYPVLGFGANEIEIALQPDSPTLARVGEMAVGVKLLPLLSKKIEVDELKLSGINASLLVNEQGENNWQATPVEENKLLEQYPEEKASSKTIPAFTLPLVTLENIAVRYQDRKSKLDYTIELPKLSLANVDLNKSFSMQFDARVRDAEKLNVMLTFSSMVNLDLLENQYRLHEMKLAAEVSGAFPKTINVELEGDVLFDQNKDNATLTFNKFSLENLVANASVNVADVSQDLTFSGQFNSGVFDGSVLSQKLGIDLPSMESNDALRKVKINLPFSGSRESASVQSLQVNIDESTLSGDVAVTDFSTQALRFSLVLDKLNADNYLPAQSDGTMPVTPNDTKQAVVELIPVDTLRGLNLQGVFKATEITLKSIPIRDVALAITAKDGLVNISDISAKAMQGTLAGSVALDARKSEPVIKTLLDINNVEIGQFLQPLTKMQVLSGRSSLKIDTTTAGNNIDQLIQQALGQINFTMADALLHGVNLNQVALEAVKNKLGDFTSLYPDYEKKLPTALKSDTQIQKLLANMKVEKGHLVMPDFNAQTGQGNFSAAGDIDLLEKGFDYRFGIVLEALSGNKYLKGVQWPVFCHGDLSMPVSEWCKPDTKAIANVFEKAAAQALRDKGSKALADKLGLDAENEKTAKEELRQKAKTEEEKAKQKVNDALNKKLKKLLN